ncbi:MAG: M36 family metallopeptidase, partial [Pseudomonadota bacterium]
MAGNPRFFRHIAKLLCAVVVIASVANPVAAAETRRDDLRSGFLTDASVQDAYAVCRDYLMTSRDAKGLSLEDVEDIEIKNRHSNPRTGVTYLYMQQRFRGIEIEGANYQTAVDKNGRIVSEVDQLKRKVRLRSPVPIIPVLSAREVVILAARELGLATDSEITQLSVETTPMKETLFSAPTLSRDDIPLKLNYIEHIDGDIRLAWNIVIRTPDGRDWWNLFVDANVGEVLKKVNWVSRASYQVYPLPVESPAVANRSIVTGVPDSIASPFGWHDTDGIVGAEYTDTRGNNVFAQEDADADDLNGLRPDGGSALEFLTALDF